MKLWILQHTTELTATLWVIAVVALGIAYCVYAERQEKTNAALLNARYISEENVRRDEQMQRYGAWWPESYGPHYRPGASCSGPVSSYGFERNGW